MMFARSVLGFAMALSQMHKDYRIRAGESRSTTAEEERNYPSRQSTIVCLLSAVIGNDMISHI